MLAPQVAKAVSAVAAGSNAKGNIDQKTT